LSCYSNVEISMQPKGRKDAFAHIYWYLSNTFWEAKDAGK